MTNALAVVEARQLSAITYASIRGCTNNGLTCVVKADILLRARAHLKNAAAQPLGAGAITLTDAAESYVRPAAGILDEVDEAETGFVSGISGAERRTYRHGLNGFGRVQR